MGARAREERTWARPSGAFGSRAAAAAFLTLFGLVEIGALGGCRRTTRGARRRPVSREAPIAEIQGIPVAPNARVRYTGYLGRAYEVDLILVQDVAGAVAAYRELLAQSDWEAVEVTAADPAASLTARLGNYRLQARFEPEGAGSRAIFLRLRSGEGEFPNLADPAPAAAAGLVPADAGATAVSDEERQAERRRALPADVLLPAGWRIEGVSLISARMFRAWLVADTPPDRSVRDLREVLGRRGWRVTSRPAESPGETDQLVATHGSDVLTLSYTQRPLDGGVGTRMFLSILRDTESPDAGAPGARPAAGTEP